MVTEIDVDRLRQKAVGALVGVVIGDAFGLPVECQSPNSIRQNFGYLDEPKDCKFHPYKQVARRGAGTISDDSQLTFAMMNALSRCHGYNLDSIRKAHVEAADGNFGPPVGWGRSTRESVQRMKENKLVTMTPEGAGNGPVIKLAPLAIYCVYKCLVTPHRRFTNSFNHSLLKKCREISELTHGDPACITAAYCHCRMLIRALQDEIPKESATISRLFIEDAEWAQEKSGGTLAERMKEVFGWTVTFNGNELRSLDIETSRISTQITTEKSSYIYNSFPLVAYCSAKYLPYRNFRHAVLETVNAGADADSNASMVGSLAGALFGFDAIPEKMIMGVKNWAKILVFIRNFVRQF